MALLNDVDLADYVNSLPDGINSIIDDMVNDIPIRYKKRIAIARSIFLGGHIVVLDDPLREADKNYASNFLNLVNKFIQDKKTIFISTNCQKIIDKADIIIDLNYNKVKKITNN